MSRFLSLACIPALWLVSAGHALGQALPAAPVPPENPLTEAKRVLGKALFWDEQLSMDNTVACGTCHIPSAGGSDPRVDMDNRHPGLDGIYGTQDDRFDSAGVRRVNAYGEVEPDPTFGFARQVTPRRSPSNIGAAFFDDLFWDGRATSTFVDPLTGATEIAQGGALESQSLGPILSSVEMAGAGRSWSDVTEKLARVRPLALATDLNPDLVGALALDPTYPDLFDHAFGTPDITPVRIAFALASYQRTLNPDQTPWDLYIAGNTNALNSTERSGLTSFMSAGLRCSQCHTPPLFSDGTYRNLGLRDIAEDNGRQGITGLASDRGKFKVPTLRNAGLRPRYFHSGALEAPSLFNAVFFYNQGGGFFLDNKDPLLNNVSMAPSTAFNITEFIRVGLTDPRVAAELPPFDRPTLRSELGPNAVLSGVARAGSGGIAPVILADMPAVSGDRGFHVAVRDGLGGALARIVVRNAAPGGPPAGGGPLAATPSLYGAPITLAGTGAGNGYGTWQRGIPNAPALVGQSMWFQWLIADAGAPRGFARTQWAELVVR
ncbi:MAG: cytochrome c peroxidase [Planctomycetota bacterium]